MRDDIAVVQDAKTILGHRRDAAPEPFHVRTKNAAR